MRGGSRRGFARARRRSPRSRARSKSPVTDRDDTRDPFDWRGDASRGRARLSRGRVREASRVPRRLRRPGRRRRRPRPRSPPHLGAHSEGTPPDRGEYRAFDATPQAVLRGGRESSAFASRILATSSGRLGGSGDVARGVGERAHGRGSRGGFRSRTRARTPRAFVRDRRERIGGSRAFACAPRARWLVVSSVFFATRREGVDPAAGGGRGSFLARGAPRAARRAALVWRRARGRSRAVPRGSLGRGGAQTRGARAVRRLRLLLGRERAERDARSRPRVVATHVVRPPLRPVVRADVRRRNRRRARHVARAKTGVPHADGCAPRREARGDPSSKRRTTRVQSVGTSEEKLQFSYFHAPGAQIHLVFLRQPLQHTARRVLVD